MAETVVEALTLNSSAEVSKKGNEGSMSVVNRPSRVRKTTERFLDSNETDKIKPKEFTIEKGKGTPLKDIPNVVYKLRKKSRADDFLILVHTLLYGNRGKAFHRKSNILKFSGFVWGENEEKLGGKLQHKLLKNNKETLLNLCDLLDIPISKTGTKKEDLVAKVIEFLESPHVTNVLTTGEANQKQNVKIRKRKGNGTPRKIPNEDLPRKRQKNSAVTQEYKGQTLNENGEEDAKEETEFPGAENHAQEADVEQDNGVADVYAQSKTSPNRLLVNTQENSGVDKTPVSDAKKQRRKLANAGSAVKSNSKEKEGANKNKEKINTTPDRPSDEDLCVAISEIISQVADFEKTTYSDIVKQLVQRFGIDLSERKLQLREMIQDELSRLVEINGSDDEEIMEF